MKWITHIEGAPKRVNHAAVAVHHKIYSFGGYCTGENSRGFSSMDVHVLNTTTFRWTKHPVSDLPYIENDDILPFKRYGHTAVVYGDKIYIWGGRNDRGSCGVLFCFDTVWHCWTAPDTAGAIPFARDGHTACIWKNFMFIFCGYEEDSDNFATDVFYLDLNMMRWHLATTSGVQPSPRDFHSTVCINDKVYLFGGRSSGSYRDLVFGVLETYCPIIMCFDPVTFEWCKIEATGDIPCGRRSHSAFVFNDKMYIFGGYNALQHVHFNDLHEFDPKSRVWTKLNILGEPPCQRRRQACVVVGNRVFLFGGTSPIPHCSVEILRPEDSLIDHGDMFVIDFFPSLKTLAMDVINKYNLDDSVLPESLRLDLGNMFSTNKLNINRPSSSTG